MKISKKFIIILLSVLALALFLKIITTTKRDPIISEFPESLIVGTTSEEPYVNLIAKTLAYKVLDMDTIKLMIVDMPLNMKENYSAFVVAGPSLHSYVIFLSSEVRSQSEIRRVLSHEFAHIQQYESGDLITIDIETGIYVWKGDTIDFTNIPYKDRGFEKEAYRAENAIRKELYSILYP